jgi:two-component system nitrogen regulation sensor histidine kinase NtrY
VSIGGKIRFLLLILSLCCIVTAISLKHSITQKDLLEHEAVSLQKKLSRAERLVNDFLNNDRLLQKVKSMDVNEDYAFNFISSFRAKGINVLTFKNRELIFWSSYKAYISEPDTVKEGSSFVKLSNGWYEVIKKTQGNYAIVFFIDVKNEYAIENQYLKNDLSESLSSSNALTLASFTDNDVYGIKNLDGKLLFEVKLLPGYSSSIYATVEVWLWVIGLFSFCLFFNSVCAWLAKRGHLVLSTCLLALFFVFIRTTDLQYHWFNHQFTLKIFDPVIYGESFFMPSLGDFLLNTISLTWMVLYIYTNKDKYRLPVFLCRHKFAGFLTSFLMLFIFSAIAFLLDRVFSGLVYNSKINFDITNIINLDWANWISIIILCLVWFNVYLIASVFMQWSQQLKITNKDRLILFLMCFTAYFLYRLSGEFTVFFIAYGLFVFVLGWNIFMQENKFTVGIYAFLFFCLAFISSIKYQRYNDIKERRNRVAIAQKFQTTDDSKILSSVLSMETKISRDTFIVNYFKDPSIYRHLTLQRFVETHFLDGFLSQFDSNIYDYIEADTVRNPINTPLSKYKDLVLSGSVKVSKLFYRLNGTFGYQTYFGIIPIMDNDHMLGTLVVEFKSPQNNYGAQFPDLLIDGKVKSDEDYSNYSMAFYNKNSLVGQSGKYTYRMANTEFKGNINKPVYIDDVKNGYNHMVYMPSTTKLVIMSIEKTTYIFRLATLSFFFLVFILFSIALYALIWVLRNIDESWGGWFNINRSLMINANKILYKTRIQFSIVLSVVATLLIVGWTTFFYISSEYRKQQDDFIREKIRKVQASYEKQISTTGIPEVNDKNTVEFSQFADINASYLNLFDIKGNLLFSSLPRMYRNGIIGPKMGPEAYIYLHHLQRSDYLNPSEKIGSFTYSSAYAPIRDSQNKTIAFVGLPYYGNEADYQSKIGLFVNTLINIYALVFVAIGILAVFLAKQITSPLTFIQESIKKTKFGQINQPIQWSRHDEIGSLIKEYNKMISALEESAAKLARSERESAWREMAKQVAHEIKNPLTPLKLGVQLLEKSWREQDVNFEKKFEKFNKSFIEQIDSLSTIASEFSNFAKMPDTKLEKIRLLPILEKTKDTFLDTPNTTIYIVDQTSKEIVILGNKDQLLMTFNNLVKNAIEATVDSRACVITINISNDKDTVWIEITDNGKGIEETLQQKMFVPNFTTKSSGTGLGLAFVKQAVENADGTINFRSVINTGTTFYLSFPLA